jgi:hypothetical protein
MVSTFSTSSVSSAEKIGTHIPIEGTEYLEGIIVPKKEDPENLTLAYRYRMCTVRYR